MSTSFQSSRPITVDSELPAQTTATNGSALVSNGITASWHNVLSMIGTNPGQSTPTQVLNTVLPTQTSSTSMFLKTDGSNATWGTPSADVPYPTEMTDAVSMQYFYDNGFLNFEPKAGKGLDPYVGVSSKFNYSWYDNQGITIFNEFDQECYYFIASDGTAPFDMFKAYKTTSESTWTIAPEPVRPSFLAANEYIQDIYSGDENHMFVNVYNTSTTTSTQTLIHTNNDSEPTTWTRTPLPTNFLSTHAQFLLSDDRIIDVIVGTNVAQVVYNIYKISDWSMVGTTKTIFDISTNVDFTSATKTITSKRVYQVFPYYIKDTNNLIVITPVLCYYTTIATGAGGYKYTTFLTSFNVPSTVITSNTGTMNTLIPFLSSDYSFWDVITSTGVHGYGTNQRINLSYNRASSTLYFNNKYVYDSSWFGWDKLIITGQLTSWNDLGLPLRSYNTPHTQYVIPSSSPWSNLVNKLMLFSNGVCMFQGDSTTYGSRWILAEYTMVSGVVTIVPGRWRLFDTKPSGAPSSVLDMALLDQTHYTNFTKQTTICVTFDASNNVKYLFCNAPGTTIYSVTINKPNLEITLTPYTVATLPALPVGYTFRNSWAYDPKRSIFYYKVTKTGEYNSIRVLAYNGTTWYESGFINETIAEASRTSYYGATRPVNAGFDADSNMLIDTTGDIYVNQAFSGVGSHLSSPYNRLTFNGTAFTIEASATVVGATWADYIMSYSAEGYSGKRLYSSEFIRTMSLTADAVARNAFITSVSSDVTITVTGSTGLIAYIAAQDIFLSGHWSKIVPMSVTLEPNTTNYIYLQRNATDVRQVDAFASTTLFANTFSKVLIASVVTDANNPISQTNYIVNETTAQWDNLINRPTIALTGAVTGSASLDSSASTITINTATATPYLPLAGGTLTGNLIASNSALHLNINGTGGSNSFFVRTGGTTSGATAILTLTYDGNLTAAGEVTAYSDPRLKENVSKIDNALEKLETLDGVYFNWKTGISHTSMKAGKKDIGVLADQVEAMFPEMVVDSAEIDGTTYKTVAYDKLVPVLIEAIKQLSALVKEELGSRK